MYVPMYKVFDIQQVLFTLHIYVCPSYVHSATLHLHTKYISRQRRKRTKNIVSHGVLYVDNLYM